jgi:hypothetical protein
VVFLHPKLRLFYYLFINTAAISVQFVKFHMIRTTDREPGSSVNTVSATGWTTRRSRFDPLTYVSRPFPGDKARLERDADHSPLSSVEVDNE